MNPSSRTTGVGHSAYRSGTELSRKSLITREKKRALLAPPYNNKTDSFANKAIIPLMTWNLA